MDPELAGLYALHVLFAGLWTGAVVFVTWAVLPLARDGDLDAQPLESIAGRVKRLSRISAVLLALTGVRMAMVLDYTETTVLFETTRGYLLVGMVTLWLVLMGVVEVGASKLADGTGRRKVREPARNARPFFLGATVVAALLLVDAGLLAAGTL
ncbi:transporter [Halapricum desulfuricans]|uniref:Putative membrane protein n=1 Tax=Halapricum desulfuricans TaxID=2841257 RepID=A0A897N2L8_9EURY|nr:transporter [Halapricum desulfuricans]QSG06947.1 putative membrane protein [Halapricum desulfuricans]